MPFKELKAHAPLPNLPGVYVVLRTDNAPPSFIADSPSGRRNGVDHSLPTEELHTHWLDSSPALYIGTATSIQKRVGAYRRNGEGGSARHWGGARLWQLTNARDCPVSWIETPGLDPETVESVLLESFKRQYASYPYANEAGPKSMTEEAREDALKWLAGLEHRQTRA